MDIKFAIQLVHLIFLCPLGQMPLGLRLVNFCMAELRSTKMKSLSSGASLGYIEEIKLFGYPVCLVAQVLLLHDSVVESFCLIRWQQDWTIVQLKLVIRCWRCCCSLHVLQNVRDHSKKIVFHAHIDLSGPHVIQDCTKIAMLLPTC